MVSGYRDPRTYTPEGEYPHGWLPVERIHPPRWRKYQLPTAQEWLNATEPLLDRHVQNSDKARKTAIIADDVPYSYAQLLRMVCKAANALTQELGLDWDSRILIIAPDRIDAVVTWLGAHRAGVVPCWVSPLYKAHDIYYFVEDLACKALFIDSTALHKLNEIQDKLPVTLKHTIIYCGDSNTGGGISYDVFV